MNYHNAHCRCYRCYPEPDEVEPNHDAEVVRLAWRAGSEALALWNTPMPVIWKQPEILDLQDLSWQPVGTELEVLLRGTNTGPFEAQLSAIHQNASDMTVHVEVLLPGQGPITLRFPFHELYSNVTGTAHIRLKHEPRVPVNKTYGPITFRRVGTARAYKIVGTIGLPAEYGFPDMKPGVWELLPSLGHDFYAPLDVWICGKAPEGYEKVITDFLEEGSLEGKVDPAVLQFLRDPEAIVAWQKAVDEKWVRERAEQELDDARKTTTTETRTMTKYFRRIIRITAEASPNGYVP